MKTVLKTFFIGILILASNTIVAAWAWYSISGLIIAITNSSGWLSVGLFLGFIIMLAMIVAVIIAEGAIVLQLINESKVEEKSNE